MNNRMSFFSAKAIHLVSIVFLVIVSCEQKEDPVVPSACFNVSKTQVEVDETIVFDNCSVDAKSYSWDFGDGKISSSVEPTHSYAEPGEYIVTLRALNREVYDEDTKIIYVNDESITLDACFTASSTSVTVGQSISFTNCSSGAETYNWSFGDGSTSTAENPSHSYNTAGTFKVVLTVTSGEDFDTYEQQIYVNEELSPVACFDYSPATIEQGQTVSFTNCSSNADSYYWEFDDGSSSTAASPSHIYNEPGNYIVKLTAYKGEKSDIESKQIEVNSSGGVTTRIDFYVDMSIEYLWGRFSFDNDYVDIAGTFNNWGNDTQYKMTYTGTDGLWYVGIDGFEIGQNVEFKFRINGDWGNAEFPEGANRTYSVKDGENIVSVWYNDVSQVEVNQYDYYGVPVNSFSDFIIDDFNSIDDTYFYVGTDTEYTTSLANGVYTVTNLIESDYLFWTSEIGPDESSNYQYEVEMKITNYSEGYGSGLFWGKNPDAFEYYYMMISPFGNYVAGYYYSSFYNWIDWSSGGLEAPSSNKLTVRKLANTYYLFINEVFVSEHAADPLYGGKFGVTIGPFCTIEYEYFYVEQINLNFGKGLIKPMQRSGGQPGVGKTKSYLKQ